MRSSLPRCRQCGAPAVVRFGHWFCTLDPAHKP
jgi:hypothetical protein